MEKIVDSIFRLAVDNYSQGEKRTYFIIDHNFSNNLVVGAVLDKLYNHFPYKIHHLDLDYDGIDEMGNYKYKVLIY